MLRTIGCPTLWMVLLAGVAASAAEPTRTVIYRSGENGYHTYRIPALVVTTKGTLLAFCEGRKTSRSDHGDIDLLLRRSTDGGRTWTDQQVVYEEGGSAKITIGNPCPVVDRTTGTVWLTFCRDNDRVFVTHSQDDGQHWAPPREITHDVKRSQWGWYATGPGNGIQLRSGRLVVPCDHKLRLKDSIKEGGFSHVIYSDDHGKTWRLGGITAAGMNECEVVELADGRLLLSMRNYLGKGRRAFAHSTDGGLTWSEPAHAPEIYCPVCQASLERHSLQSDGGKTRLLYSGPGGPDRQNLLVRLSEDEGESWPVGRVLHPGPAAYSALAVLGDGTICCLYEGGEKSPYEALVFARFPLAWLTAAPK